MPLNSEWRVWSLNTENKPYYRAMHYPYFIWLASYDSVTVQSIWKMGSVVLGNYYIAYCTAYGSSIADCTGWYYNDTGTPQVLYMLMDDDSPGKPRPR